MAWKLTVHTAVGRTPAPLFLSLEQVKLLISLCFFFRREEVDCLNAVFSVSPWDPVLTLPFTSCVTCGQVFDFLGSQCLHL